MKLFLLDDSEYVAAETEAEARQHMLEVCGVEAETADEQPLTLMCQHDELGKITAADLIDHLRQTGTEFPTLIGSAGDC